MFGRFKKHADKSAAKKEDVSRKNVIEELFYDFNASRVQIYKMNFFRGIFFGLGSRGVAYLDTQPYRRVLPTRGEFL